MQLKVQLVNPNAKLPTYANPGDACFDLYAAEECVVRPGETVNVGTGLVMEIPEGYEVQIRPRSGISKKTPIRLPNAPGTIDSGYRGEVGVLLWNSLPKTNQYYPYVKTLDGEDVEGSKYGATLGVGTVMIRVGDRIAQACLAQVTTAEFEEVKATSKTKRGTGGFGHSGTR